LRLRNRYEAKKQHAWPISARNHSTGTERIASHAAGMAAGTTERGLLAQRY
jgi:hypothetical protein